jgi:hypothetical protein
VVDRESRSAIIRVAAEIDPPSEPTRGPQFSYGSPKAITTSDVFQWPFDAVPPLSAWTIILQHHCALPKNAISTVNYQDDVLSYLLVEQYEGPGRPASNSDNF